MLLGKKGEGRASGRVSARVGRKEPRAGMTPAGRARAERFSHRAFKGRDDNCLKIRHNPGRGRKGFFFLHYKDSFTQQIFIKHLLCVRYCSGHLKYIREQSNVSVFMGLMFNDGTFGVTH